MMGRETKAARSSTTHAAASMEIVVGGDTALINVTGLVDERFAGFGELGELKSVIINVAGMTRMTSFGVRQWLRAMDAIPKTVTDRYLFGCPTFFVDQLNMVVNFGGSAKVLTVVAPYVCPSCGLESGELIDVLTERANLAKLVLPEKQCSKCSGKLEFDETPEAYFAFVGKYAATSIQPNASQLLAQLGLYTVVTPTAERPPRIIKLVHESVTYFRIIGTIGAMFRARPFLVGAEGEIVIDLAEVDRFEVSGMNEWRRLVKSLATQQLAVTLVDVPGSGLVFAAEALQTHRNITLASVLVPHRCGECQRETQSSTPLDLSMYDAAVCSHCGGATYSLLGTDVLRPFEGMAQKVPEASAKVVARRDEILSRALTDANVAQAGDAAVAHIGAEDTILGKYKIVRPLSTGGMAEVFLAKLVGIGGFEKPVALKRIQRKLLDNRQQAIELFLNEAKIAGRLTHPNIVQVLDVGEVDGALYLAMEYVHGKDLRTLLKKLAHMGRTLSIADACFIVREVAQALHHAYWSTDMDGKRLAVVHRDVSPHNIIIGYDGTVKLIDFGVAMSAVTEHTGTMIVGKWLYMSPETTLNEQVDHRSDLFSLGVNLYLLCTGNMPFSGREPREIVKNIRAGAYKPLDAAPPQLAALVSHMLASNPDDRPQRGQEVVTALSEIGRSLSRESTSVDIAVLMSEAFPGQSGGAIADTDMYSVKELVQFYPDDPNSMTTRDKSIISVTPTASQYPGLGISEQFQGAAVAGLDLPEPERRSASVSHAYPGPPSVIVAPSQTPSIAGPSVPPTPIKSPLAFSDTANASNDLPRAKPPTNPPPGFAGPAMVNYGVRSPHVLPPQPRPSGMLGRVALLISIPVASAILAYLVVAGC